MDLADLQVLALDCQATGANPLKGHLLEIGWMAYRVADADTLPERSPEAHLVRLPPQVEIPSAVQRVTGLSIASMDKAQPAPPVWKMMVSIAGEIAIADRLDRCPTIIHFARFEEAFLRQLHAENDSEEVRFPLRIICSHDIARRLLPGLPRKGLRAVAGYFGHSVSPLRRAGEHAMATAFIWKHLVRQLDAQHDIVNLEQLMDWLKHPPATSPTKRVFPMDPQIRSNLPDKPGVYRMRRSNGDLLYIGKATCLKQRINSYFRPKAAMAEHTLEMISQAADLDWTLKDSALEAAVLESDEIKRYAPPYNVALQRGQRRLAFCSRDLQQIAGTPDSTHCLGPLPWGNLTATMKAFGTWHATDFDLSGDALLHIGNTIIGVSEAYAPPPDCLAEGLDLFRTDHLHQYRNHLPLRALTTLGFSLWRQRLAALQQARPETGEEDADKTTDQEPETQTEPTWTAEAVCRTAEYAVMQSALLIRRARWLCLLSESTLVWDRRGALDGSRNVLMIAKGRAVHRMRMSTGVQPPVPDGHAKRMPERQKGLDLTTYERLRVITTELRRLVTGGRHIEVWITPTAALGSRQLAILLPWV